jgi:hypothetical protein
MKRNTLLIAIAAIAVVGIAVGLFLSGAGQNGQLSGTLAPKPTTLTLTYTVPMEDGSGGYMLDVRGRLADSTGASVANRPVRIRWKLPSETVIHDVGTATTGADGSYNVQFEQYSAYYGLHPVYYAEFAGDSQFRASRSPDVQGP